MSKKSAAHKLVRKSSGELTRATPADLNRLRSAMQGSIDLAEIPERRDFRPLQRDAGGMLPARKSLIREAVRREMKHLNLTAYRLWRMARVHYPALSQSAVHEFLKGQRQLELPSVEALLAAVQLQVVRKRDGRGRQSSARATGG